MSERDDGHRHSDALQPQTQDLCAISGASDACELLPGASVLNMLLEARCASVLRPPFSLQGYFATTFREVGEVGAG